MNLLLFLALSAILCHVSLGIGEDCILYTSGTGKLPGCYKDKANRDLPHKAFNGAYLEDMTQGKCISKCREGGYRYAGLQAKGYCFCGNKYGSYGIVSKAECNRPCTGALERCGDEWRNWVMAVPGSRGKRDVLYDPLYVHTRTTRGLHVPDVDEAVELAALTLAGEIPIVGSFIAAILELFWPRDEPSVWEQVEEQVKNEIHKALTQQYKDFWKYVQREMKTVIGETKLLRRKYTRLHGLDQQLGAEEHKLITRGKDHPYEVLLQYLPFATARLSVMAELVCVGNRDEIEFALKVYIHKLAEYVATIPYMIEEATKWRRKQFSCGASSHWSGKKHCKKWDGVEKKLQTTWKIGTWRCTLWCQKEITVFMYNKFRKEALAPLYRTLTRWAKSNKRAKAILQKHYGVKTDNGCYTDSRGSDYTGKVAKTKSGKPCIQWSDVTCKHRNLKETCERRHFYFENAMALSRSGFYYDSNGIYSWPRNYCRNPAEPLLDRFPAPYCFTAEVKREECNVPRCGGFSRSTFDKRMVDVQGKGES